MSSFPCKYKTTRNHLYIKPYGCKRYISEYDMLAIISDIDNDQEFDNALSILDKLVPVNNSTYFTLRCNIKMLRVAMKRTDRINTGERKTYLMTDKNTGFTKIGSSITPPLRERTLQSEKPTISLVKVCDLLVEKELHIIYKDKNIRGEWFCLSKKDIEHIIKSYNFYDYE